MGKCTVCGGQIYSSPDKEVCSNSEENKRAQIAEANKKEHQEYLEHIQNNPIILTTTSKLEGKKIQKYLGVVRGITVRSPTITQGLSGGLKKIVGGTIGAYVQMCETARSHAFEMMVEHAKKLGANAIIGIQYDASDLGDSSTEVLCYGTAVKFE